MAKISARGDSKYCDIQIDYNGRLRTRGVITNQGRILVHDGYGYTLYERMPSAAAALELMERRGWIRV